MDSYLTTQRSTIFQHVGVLIYVFDVESRETHKDLEYYRDCLESLGQFSAGAVVFLLVHKMDLVRVNKSVVFEKKKGELQSASGDFPVLVFGTSIYDESLYKVNPSSHPRILSFPLTGISQAWSSIVHMLIPNGAVLSRHLATLAEACSATEVILFERTTFLVIATSSTSPSSPDQNASDNSIAIHQLDPTRYERTSELIKAFKHSCSRVREEFHSLEMELADFTAVLDELTRNTYIMIIVHDPTIGSSLRLYWIVGLMLVLCRDRSVEDKYPHGAKQIRATAVRDFRAVVARPQEAGSHTYTVKIERSDRSTYAIICRTLKARGEIINTETTPPVGYKR